MEQNLLLEQYSWYKKKALEASPYRCLLDADIQLNPHQVNAYCAAVQSLRTGGIVLADEVGLGKTIEAGLSLKHAIADGARHILIALPATLRKQWEIELQEKFGLESFILDRPTVENDLYHWKSWLEKGSHVRIVLASYDYASKLMQRFPDVKWDLVIIDEAHNLRNVFHGTKRAKRLYELTKGIPKILLTATPLQNSLTDLHGLISFIDPRIFGSERLFNKRFIEGEDYAELKRELSPVLYRTLRRDVARYMDFRKRTCRTVDFTLSRDEAELYMRVNTFLKRETLYSIPTANRGLIVLVIRKLLASSSYALIETFEVLRKRLEKLYQGTRSASAQEGFDLFWAYVEDEIDEEGLEEEDDPDAAFQKQQIQEEMDLSHYENFTGYHSQLYRFVEGTTATPFSARARDRVLHALVIAAIRLKYPDMAQNDAAANIGALTDEQMQEVESLILDRLGVIKPSVRQDAEAEIEQFIDSWKRLAAESRPLKYKGPLFRKKDQKYNALMGYYGGDCADTEKPTLTSMRDVEGAANMFYYEGD